MTYTLCRPQTPHQRWSWQIVAQWLLRRRTVSFLGKGPVRTRAIISLWYYIIFVAARELLWICGRWDAGGSGLVFVVARWGCCSFHAWFLGSLNAAHRTVYVIKLNMHYRQQDTKYYLQCKLDKYLPQYWSILDLRSHRGRGTACCWVIHLLQTAS